MKNRKLESIKPLLKKYVSPSVKAVMTDGYQAYRYFDKETAIPHGVVIHKKQFQAGEIEIKV